MINTYRTRFISMPTISEPDPIAYAIEIESNTSIDTLQIRRAVANAKRLSSPEAIADSLANNLPGKQTVTSWHDGVQVITTRGAAK